MPRLLSCLGAPEPDPDSAVSVERAEGAGAVAGISVRVVEPARPVGDPLAASAVVAPSAAIDPSVAHAGPRSLVGDNCCACNLAAFRVVANSGKGEFEHYVADEDILYISFGNDSVYRVVFAVLLDHINKAVVVVVRGTFSFRVHLHYFLYTYFLSALHHSLFAFTSNIGPPASHPPLKNRQIHR